MLNMYHTKNDHFKYGFNLINKSLRQKPDDKWFVDYGRCEKVPDDFLTECINAIRDIRNKTNKTLYFLYSGGIDSEMMCNAVLLSKISNFEILIADYDNNNSHDLEYAKLWCENNNITPHIFKIDVLQFWSSDEFKNITKTINCSSPQFPVYMKVMEYVNNLSGVPILGSGECYLENDHLLGLVMFERELVASLYRFLDANGLDGIPGFFQYSPELMLSWLQNPLVEKMLRLLPVGQNSLTSIKYVGYKQYCSDMTKRPKYTGFEKIQNICNSVRAERTHALRAVNEITKTPYNKLIEKLAPNV